MGDVGDQRLRAWFAEPPPQELVLRTALNARAKNLGADWDRRVTVLMRECKIDSAAKIAKPLTAVRKQRR